MFAVMQVLVCLLDGIIYEYGKQNNTVNNAAGYHHCSGIEENYKIIVLLLNYSRCRQFQMYGFSPYVNDDVSQITFMSDLVVSEI
jgi:hypothetical protein